MNQGTDIKQKWKQVLLFLIVFFLLIFLDQITKYYAVLNLKDQDPFVILNGIFEFQYLENRGAAFGMLEGRQFFFFFVAAVVLIIAIYVMYKIPYQRKYLPLGICAVLITSGAVGNMIDRIQQSYVVDFLYFKWINFPIFNVADCYVTVGTALLVLLFLCYYKEEDLDVFSFHRKGETHCKSN